MIGGAPFQGSLFAEDFLRDSVSELPDWNNLTEATLDDLEDALRNWFVRFPTEGSPNESQTEDDLIWPVLAALGWTAGLRQQNLSARGREDVPDGYCFSTTPPRFARTLLLRNGSVTASESSSLSRSVGFARLTAARTVAARKPHRPAR